jgi:thiopurine S-methyltransferase
MNTSFWFQKWNDREIGFHQLEANPLLTDHFSTLSLPTGSRVLVPLCGKTPDMRWLLSQTYQVAGVEMVETAVEEFFEESRLEPTVSKPDASEKHGGSQAAMQRYHAEGSYHAEGIDLFAGDFFALSPEQLGPVDAAYDRAALVALPEEMRSQYADHLKALVGPGPQLLITFRYDQSKMEGPPFSISPEELKRLYGDTYHITRQASVEVPGGLKGRCPAQEEAWTLRPK